MRVPIPPKMLRLPRDVAGRPIPWFVADLPDGTRDPRIACQVKRRDAFRFGWCWVCGQGTGAKVAYVLGPMCVINRVTSEPGCHRECAEYSALACPFLTTPNMTRRTSGLESTVPAPGMMIARNPGATAIWVTRRDGAKLKRAPGGVLVDLAQDPIEVLWMAHGRTATAQEVAAAIESGLPLLRGACERDQDPGRSLRDLQRECAAAGRWLPAGVTVGVDGVLVGGGG